MGIVEKSCWWRNGHGVGDILICWCVASWYTISDVAENWMRKCKYSKVYCVSRCRILGVTYSDPSCATRRASWTNRMLRHRWRRASWTTRMLRHRWILQDCYTRLHCYGNGKRPGAGSVGASSSMVMKSVLMLEAWWPLRCFSRRVNFRRVISQPE